MIYFTADLHLGHKGIIKLCSIHLYGHVHNSNIASSWTPSNIQAFNVGVDVCDFKPISIGEVIKRANKIAVVKTVFDYDDKEKE